MADKKFNIKTPHGLVVIWNYDDRGSSNGYDNLNGISQTMKLTLSCVSMRTTKSKGNPAGSFEFVLAPTKNWAAEITPGSWCALLMSNKPLTKDDIEEGNKESLKMIGRIDTVRADVKSREDGSRITYYTVSGSDWGGVFNQYLYFDPYIDDKKNPRSNMFLIIEAMLSKNIVKSQDNGTLKNIANIVSIFGKPIPDLEFVASKTGPLDTAMFTMKIPREMKNYIGARFNDLSNIIDITGGQLIAPGSVYNNESDSWGILDPYSFQGQHTFWQVLLAHSNPAINEMFAELTWEKDTPTFTLFCRVRPFNFIGDGVEATLAGSLFTFLEKTKIETVDVLTLNAGTNWRDKFNFAEVKLDIPDAAWISAETRGDQQAFDKESFNREGFRPFITSTRQFPLSLLPSMISSSNAPDLSGVRIWAQLLASWYFETHRMLNGTITFVGQDEFIGVGENIQFSTTLLSASPNSSSGSAALAASAGEAVLAHVETISHTFEVDQETGARSFRTTVQFVRGVLVDAVTGKSARKLDQLDTDMGTDIAKNKNVTRVSTNDDPDKRRL